VTDYVRDMGGNMVVARWAFSVAGLMTFSALSDQICDLSVNTATFIRLLKTHFFSV